MVPAPATSVAPASCWPWRVMPEDGEQFVKEEAWWLVLHWVAALGVLGASLAVLLYGKGPISNHEHRAAVTVIVVLAAVMALLMSSKEHFVLWREKKEKKDKKEQKEKQKKEQPQQQQQSSATSTDTSSGPGPSTGAATISSLRQLEVGSLEVCYVHCCPDGRARLGHLFGARVNVFKCVLLPRFCCIVG